MQIKFLRFIDRTLIAAVLFVCCLPSLLRRSSRSGLPAEPQSILLIRVWGLGSSLIGFSLARELRQRFPDARLDLLASTRNISVFRHQDYFARAYNLFAPADLLAMLRRFRHYDVVFDCEEYFRTSSLMAFWLGKVRVGYRNIRVRRLAYTHLIEYNPRQHAVLSVLDLLRPLGLTYEPPASLEPLRYTEADAVMVAEFLRQFPSDAKLVCMHVGGAETSQERFWASERWAQLIHLLIDACGDQVRVFLSGTAREEAGIREVLSLLSDREKRQVMSLCDVFSLPRLAALLERVDLMISNDTGPMHLAAAMGTPTIGLFGPQLPQRFGPYPPSQNKAFYKGDGRAYINVHLGRFARCPHDLLNRIAAEEVFAAALELLS